MPRSQRWLQDRRLTFKMALGLRSLTIADWAASNGFTHTHLNLVLRGKRESKRIDMLVYHLCRWAFGPTAERFNPDMT